ncbi:MAG: hypothetical protein PHE68_06075 [Candidatus Peribacteraceae bacterium]|nr:hypothetical protein [Candidatus Peribacteraceae bacterium]MDD5075393.1 hypothetical protein [Candidatus Peribacteraceae bacterium]
MNIILKGFDDWCGKPIIETAFRGLRIGTCISILNDRKQWPDLDTEEHIWMPASPLREGRYPDVNWMNITPLDEELVESMRHCEAVFLRMVERYARYGDLPYEERLRQYREHLRYWNHMLETKKIGLVLMYTLPHQCYDLVIYDLCKLKGIPVLYLARYYLVDAFSVETDWQEVGKALQERLLQLQKQYADTEKPVPLTDRFENYFQSFTRVDADPWYMFRRGKHLEYRSFLRKWAGIAILIAFFKPAYFLRSVVSPSFWARKWKQHRTAMTYDRFTKTPDLSLPYVYVPLHMQPEATTCPMGGVYADQELMVQILAAHLPEGVRLYVKEHPAQGEMCRSTAFYEALHAIPSVSLVPRHFSTFALRDNALAIASVTGTACFEGLFHEKPALMFGHQFFQFAPGVFRIRSAQDCARAFKVIMEKKEAHTIRDMRLFLKAIEETTQPYAGAPPSPHMPLSKEEKAVGMGRVIAERLQPYFR